MTATVIPQMWLAGRAGHYERQGLEPWDATQRAISDWMEQERLQRAYEEQADE